ncbi:MAG: hypothetical protein H6622_01670 [Halobacteriovoraceae bacterium]|nr:hypothetical protein [Halobacteriovoraceae bacterium]
MSLLFECIKCRTKLKIDEKYIGKKVKCPNCGLSREMTREFLVADELNLTFKTQSISIKSADLSGKSKYKQRIMANRAQQGLPISGYRPVKEGTSTSVYYQKIKQSEGLKRIIAVLVLAAVAYYVYISLEKEKYAKLSGEAIKVLNEYHRIQTDYFSKYGRYDMGLDFSDDLKSKGYTYSVISNLDENPGLKEICSECIILDKSFKVLAFKNLDSDEVFDIWSIDDKKNVVHLVDDYDNTIKNK